LTEQQLLKMKAAGISQDLIVQQIQSEGVAFPVDPDAMIALKKAGFSDAVLGALLKAPTGTGGPSSTQAAARIAQPPAQAQLDPCVAWHQEYDRLDTEATAIVDTCDALGKRRGPGFTQHCYAMNCSVHKRLWSFPDPNKCNIDDGHNLLDCDDNAYTPDPRATFHPVQAMNADDSKLSCGQLKVLVWSMQENVGHLDTQIQNLNGQAQSHSQNAQTENAMASAAPRLAPGLTMMGSSELNQSSSDSRSANEMQQVRDSLLRRHDFLTQIYFQKRCDL
jgi:hypothetical protein